MIASTTIEPTVATLEDAMRELAFQSARTQEELARLSREMRDFKEEMREFFPDYRDVPVIGIQATLSAEESVVRDASKLGFLVLAVGDELMEVQNPPGFEPKRW